MEKNGYRIPGRGVAGILLTGPSVLTKITEKDTASSHCLALKLLIERRLTGYHQEESDT